jgi:hypothetical protein
MHSPEAAALLNNKEALKKLLQSPDTKRLMSLLTSQNGDGLKQAAQQAQKGDVSSLTAMMQKLMTSQEGATLVHNIENSCKEQK